MKRMLLVAIYGRLRLSLPEVAHQLCISPATVRNQRALGAFPIPMAGNPLSASVDDVAAYLVSLETEKEEA